MDGSGKDLIERLRAGGGFGAVLFAALPEPTRQALRGCAAQPSFDRPLYDGDLRPTDGPGLDQLVEEAHVEPAPGAQGRYQVAASLQEPAFADWWVEDGRVPGEPPVPARLRELAAAAAARHEAAGRPLDALDQLLLCDEEAAGALFTGLYDAADAVHDLPGCQSLLDVLESPHRLPLVGQDLLELRHDRSAYLGARNLWSTAYYQSARYLPRPAVERALQELLDGRDGRILQLYAPSGMGKTMQLRWFIARRCVPAPLRVPCAWIECDTVAAARHPWLLLVEIAAQLDPQFRYGPFQDLLASYSPYRVLLSTATGTAAPLEVPVGADDVDGEDLRTRFTSVLVESAGDGPVVVAFDDVENLLRPDDGPAGLLGLLGRLHDDVAALRLILAGRDDLRTRLPNLAELLPAGLHSVQLGPLADSEQARYLRDSRHMDDPELVEAIVRRSGGTPFMLELLADLVAQEPGIDARQIERLHDQELTTLADRVLASVDDNRLRWLLRYGVVPRVLTPEFLANVMAPVMPPAPPTEAELRDLWHQLVKYASTRAWVSVTHGEDAVRFHPEMAPALRRLIREEPVTARLHRAAEQWFDQLTRERPDRWASFAAEEVYHAYQVDPVEGDAAWRNVMSTARVAGRLDWVVQLTENLLGHGSQDEADAEATGREGVPPQTLAEANLEHGRASAELALAGQEPGEHPLWCDAEASLLAAKALARSVPGLRLPEPATTVLEARVLIARGRAAEAERLLRAWRGPPEASPEVADLERALGDALAWLGRDEAAEHYRRSYELAEAAADTPQARLAVLGLARQRIDRCRVDQALERLDHAVGDGQLDDDDELAALIRTAALGAAGMPVRACRLVERFTGDHPDASIRMAAARAALRLAAAQPEQAVAACSEILQRLAREPGPSANLTADVLATRGSAYATLLELEPAVADLLLAANRARDLRDLDRSADYAARAAALHMHQVGDLRGAAQAIDEAERALSEPAQPGWVAARVARAQLLDRTGKPTAAQGLIDSMWPVLDRHRAGPAAWLHTAVGGLTLRPSAGDATCMRVLVEQLEEVQPPVARLPPLEGLRDATVSRREVDAGLTRALAEVALSSWLETGPAPPPEPADQALLCMTGAEVLRVVGRDAEARALLDRAIDLRSDGLLWWRWLQVHDRIGPADEHTPAPPDGLGLGSRFPVLGAAYLITLALHRLEVDGYDHATERLQRAAALLSRPGRAHRWTARLLEAEAVVASRGGRQTDAHRLAASAVHTWGGLGDDRRQKQLGQDYSLGSVRGDLDAGTLELGLTRVVGDGPMARAAVRMPDGRELGTTSSTAVLGDQAAGAATNRARSAVQHMLSDWHAWTLAAARLLPAEARRLLARDRSAGQLDVRLVVSDRELAAIPWELARLPEADGEPLVRLPAVAAVFRGLPTEARNENKIRALQTVLRRLGLFDGVVDGLVGSITSLALQHFQEQAGLDVDGVAGRATWAALHSRVVAEAGPLRPVRVLVVRPDRTRELGRRRGATAGGTDLVTIYRKHGALASVLEDPTLAGLRAYSQQLRQERPDVVHVCGTVVLLGGATVLDLGGDAAARAVVRGTARADQLSVNALGELLAALDNAPYGPVVVLDVAAPHTRAETLRALLVRNSFAQQLLGLGHAVAVVATGLVAPAEQDRLYGRLVGGLAARADPASVVRRLHAEEPPDQRLESALPFQGTALHLHRPPYTLLPPGLA